MVLLCVAEDRFIAGRQPVPIPNAECPQIDPAGAPVESHPVLRVRQFDKQFGVVLKPPGQEIFHREHGAVGSLVHTRKLIFLGLLKNQLDLLLQGLFR